MAQFTMVSHGDSAAVILPTAVLEALGVPIGASVEVAVAERQLICEILDQRRDAYRRLA